MIKHLPLVDNTDTTFLGIVPSDSLFNGQQLSNTMNITEGFCIIIIVGGYIFT